MAVRNFLIIVVVIRSFNFKLLNEPDLSLLSGPVSGCHYGFFQRERMYSLLLMYPFHSFNIIVKNGKNTDQIFHQ